LDPAGKFFRGVESFLPILQRKSAFFGPIQVACKSLRFSRFTDWFSYKFALVKRGSLTARDELRRSKVEMSTGGRSASRDRLRIAQIAPLYERVPPELYGGTERGVSYITEELVNRGHEVTLFASGDSQTRSNLEPRCQPALRLLGKPELGASLQLAMLADVFGSRDRFVIVHSHIDYWSFPFARMSRIPTVSTMHGRLDIPDLHAVYERFPEAALISISDAQRA